jgi:hypothetical protein
MRPTNGWVLICEGLMGADSVRHRRIGAGSSLVWRSKGSRALSIMRLGFLELMMRLQDLKVELLNIRNKIKRNETKR